MILSQKLRLLGLLASTALVATACGHRNTTLGALDGGSAPTVSGSNGASGTSGSTGATGATGASGTGSGTGTAGANGTNGTNGTNGNATVASNPLGGLVNANVAGLQVGGTGPNGTPATVTASVLGTTPATNAPVSASVLSGSGNQVQGLLTNVSTTLTNPGTLTASLGATTAPILGASGTLPVVSDLLGGLLPSNPNAAPLAGVNLAGTQLLGNGRTPSVLNVAALSPNAAAGSPITANVLSGGSSAGLLGGATGGLPVVGGVLGGATGGAGAAGILAPVTNLVGGLTGGAAGGGALAPVTNVVSGVVGGVTGGTAGGGALAPVTNAVSGVIGRTGGTTGALAPVTNTVNGLLGGALGGLRR